MAAAMRSNPHRRHLALALSAMPLAATAVAAAAPAPPPPGPIAQRYRDDAARIGTRALADHAAFRTLAELCDGIGHRLSGSAALDRALIWAADTMRDDGQENVRIEPVLVPCWVRGAESLVMVTPREMPMVMLGLGGSVGTPPEGITAEVVVVSDEAALEALGEGARGRIVLFNNPMPPYDPQAGSGYGTAVRFRSNGARLAAAHGAVACLVRSVTATSLRTPHTGAMRYGDAPVRIPAAAVTLEDAELLARLHARGEPARVRLTMEARTLAPARSGNVIGELRGRERPQEIVVIGGHIDSWDVGQGAHDDGTGCVMAMEALRVLRELGLRPRRTIRVVLWTNEENGLAGANQYAADHAAELPHHVAAIESDSGGFAPVGLSLECADAARQERAAEQLRDLAGLLAAFGAGSVETGFSGADVGPMRDAGVVLMGHRVEGSTYFDYHHSPADTLDKVDPDDLARNVAVMAITAWVLAEMEDRLGGAPAPAE
jgi:carboxypeptidase Q